jgi:hypothetical protein
MHGELDQVLFDFSSARDASAHGPQARQDRFFSFATTQNLLTSRLLEARTSQNMLDLSQLSYTTSTCRVSG